MANQNDVNLYLDDLRESSVVNMYGAGEYIMITFDVNKKVAREMLKVWMDTFAERHKEME